MPNTREFNMNMRTRHQGFSLLEMMISMSLGLIVMGSMVQLFKMATTTSRLVVQRTEMQQNMRAAIELMTKDISLAGSGLPDAGIQLPLGGKVSQYGCDQTTCHVPGGTYPSNGTPAVPNYMTGILPGYSNGVEAKAVIPAAPGTRSDSITVIYADYSFPLNQYWLDFPTLASTGTQLNVNVPFPAPNPVPPLITSVGGIQVGDVIWLSNSVGNAVGEVTALNNGSLTFADNDALNLNQSGAAITNNIRALNNGTHLQGYRLFVVTYYLTVPANGESPRLMRQVNGRTPVPVADDVINLQFAYDLFNSDTNALDPNQADPLSFPKDALGLIQKVNISVMGQSLANSAKGAQNMRLATSVSARNMAFFDRYK
jgi:prepilin-type N-terminal cleavage/methylation domain-containing protein